MRKRNQKRIHWYPLLSNFPRNQIYASIVYLCALSNLFLLRAHADIRPVPYPGYKITIRHIKKAQHILAPSLSIEQYEKKNPYGESYIAIYYDFYKFKYLILERLLVNVCLLQIQSSRCCNLSPSFGVIQVYRSGRNNFVVLLLPPLT